MKEVPACCTSSAGRRSVGGGDAASGERRLADPTTTPAPKITAAAAAAIKGDALLHRTPWARAVTRVLTSASIGGTVRAVVGSDRRSSPSVRTRWTYAAHSSQRSMCSATTCRSATAAVPSTYASSESGSGWAMFIDRDAPGEVFGRDALAPSPCRL
jgi:hypothetical protein